MPAQNLELIGAAKKNMLGMAGHSNYGFLWEVDIVVTAKPEHKKRAIRLLGGKCAIA